MRSQRNAVYERLIRAWLLGLSVVSPRMDADGWPFADVDPFPGADVDTLNGAKHIKDLYLSVEPNFTGR